MSTIAQAIDLAIRAHQAGRIAEAENLYRQILARQPDHPDALHMLGVAAHQAGRNIEAIELIGKALRLRPAAAHYHCNLGLALLGDNQPEQAAAEFNSALAITPAFPEAHNNLGSALKRLGRHDEAIAAFARATTLRLSFAEAHYNLGNALMDARRLDDAINSFRRAVAARPNYFDALNNLANALRLRGNFDQAIDIYRKLLALQSQAADRAKTHSNLATVLKDAGQFDEAIAQFRAAIALDPNLAEAHHNLATALRDAGQIDEALAAAQRAVDLRPDFAAAATGRLYMLNLHPAYDAAAIFAEHRKWNERVARPLVSDIARHDNDRSPDRRLRIGYVSADFRMHPVARLLLPLLAHHDQSAVEVFAYADVNQPDAMTARVRSHVDVWRDASVLSDEEVARQVREDRIDILIDLGMHTVGNRLLTFARKPAPVQATYLAYCGTTGLETIDYRLTDPYLDPPGMPNQCYSEASLHLPRTYWIYEEPTAAPTVNPLPALANGYVTFGCFNNYCKVSDRTLETWARLLADCSGSRLTVVAGTGLPRRRVLDAMARQGVDADRIRFVGRAGLAEYFAFHHQIDIALDPFPYGGGTTTLDALWMGIPVVSLAGKTAVGRGGLSILSNAGLPELVATSAHEYVQLAMRLAHNLDHLAGLRTSMRERMLASPLMDAPSFARDMEAAFRKMWLAYVNDPAGI
ncbi:MAG TPA: tetratricopeptide repeat protein [Humisphaera sp.]|jgi:predicted O-linked N-acetylglucosamine transferase (SPINDLY family)|nr:tetratricopeptide repeat protein [Humisphaera sp.]